MTSLFIAHGAPLLAVEDNEYTRFLSQLGQSMPRPKAVVIFSAHWLSDTQQVGAPTIYETIHDFGGFPDELYQIQYPAKGTVEVAQDVKRLLNGKGIPNELNDHRGLDHGAWVVLRLLYPEADVPVISMSVNPRLSPADQYGIGEALSGLGSDILVIASDGTAVTFGNSTYSKSG